MDYRPLGRTGVQVSPLCLGAMMFGPWGNDDRTDSIRIIHRALDAGINFVDTADVYSGGSLRRDRRRGAAGPTRRRLPRHQVLHADERRPEPARRLPSLDHARGRELAAAPEHRLHRPLPGAPTEPGHRRRGDPRRAHRPRPAGQGALHRLVVVLGVADRGGAVGVARAQPGTVRHRAAAVLDPRRAASRRTCSRRSSATGWARSRTARWAADGCRAGGGRMRHPRPPRPPAPAPGST